MYTCEKTIKYQGQEKKIATKLSTDKKFEVTFKGDTNFKYKMCDDEPILSGDVRSLSYRKTLDMIAIGECVDTIEPYAFSDNGNSDNLRLDFNGELYLSNTLKYIGDYAFGYNLCDFCYRPRYPNLKQERAFNLPEIVEIGDGAFLNIHFEWFEFPNTLTRIGDKAFRGYNPIIYPEGYSCPYLNQDLYIPSSVTYVGDEAFYSFNNSYFSSVTFDQASTITSLNIRVFCGNNLLEVVSIPNTVTSIGGSAFSFCDNLRYISDMSNVTYIGDAAFSNCYSLKNFELPSGLTHIGSRAFWECSGITEITIPSSVTYIGADAFNSLKPIGSNLYVASSNLSSVTFVGETPPTFGGEPYQFPFASDIESVYVPCNAINTYTLAMPPAFSVKIKPIGYCPYKAKLTYDNKLWPNTYPKVSLYVQGCDGEPITSDDIFDAPINGYVLQSATIGECPTSIADDFLYQVQRFRELNILSGVSSIGDRAFYGCFSFTSLTFSEDATITRIGDYAFSLCISLTSATIPDSVTDIGVGAFKGANTLKVITLPSGITSIKGYTFSGCSELANLKIPSSVTSIGESAFELCTRMVNIIGMDNVTSIGDRAFDGCFSFTSLTIPSGVTSIGNYTFSNCWALSSVTLHSGVTSIGEYAFNRCSGLTSISIPSSVTSIGYCAFYYCSGLTSITLQHTTPPTLGEGAFYITYCPIYVPCISVDLYKTTSGWSEYASRIQPIPNCLGEWRTVSGEYMCVLGDKYTLEEGYLSYDGGETWIDANIQRAGTLIESGSADCPLPFTISGITNASSDFTIKVNGVDETCTVYEDTGYGWKWGIIYNDEVTSIDASGRTYLVSIDLGGVVTSGMTSIGNNAFSGCSDLEEFTIPSSVTSIGDYAFARTKLAQVDIPSGVTSIGQFAFSNCGSLTSVTIPSSVTSIGYGAFEYCRSLTNLTIPSGVTTIGVDAFYHCDALGSIDIPNSVTSIGIQAFASCGLSSVTIPSSITTIEEETFAGCTSLASLTIPSSVTTIGASAFWNCRSLSSISIPSSVTSIGNNAFNKCSGLTSITCLEITPPSLGTSVFDSTNNSPIYVPCSSVDLYKAATNWSSYSSRIQSIPNCTTEWRTVSGEYVCILGGKYTLEEGYLSYDGGETWIDTNIQRAGTLIESGSTDCPISISGLTKSSSDFTIKLNGSNVNCKVYENNGDDTYNWEMCDNSNVSSFIASGNANLVSVDFCDIETSGFTILTPSAFTYCTSLASIEIPSGVTSIGEYAFYNCTSLTSVEIPSAVTSIGDRAFYYCTSLASIEIPSGVTTIGYAMFSNCSSLTSVTLYSGVTSIGDYAFNNCSGLTSISIPSSVTSIGNDAFRSCSRLASITIPNGVTSIASYSFASCTSLTSITIPSAVTSIGTSAFTSCRSLTSVTIPDSVTEIGNVAFGGCSRLTSITCLATTPPTLGSNAFLSTNDCRIYVPSASVNAYKSASGWSNYASRIQAIP